MSNFDERGAYTPREEPLAFDARQSGGHGGGGRAPTTLIISAAVLILLAAGVFFYYRSGVRHQGEAPRVLGQPVGQITTPPPADAQPSDTAAGLEVYKTEQPATQSQPQFAPAPEQPVARPAPPPPQPAPRATLPPAAPAPAPARPVATPTPAPATSVATKPTPATPRPSTAPDTAPATPMNIAAAGDTRAPAALAAARTPPAAKPAPVAAGGASVVQIGAFSNAAQADKGWNDAARLVPGAIAGHGKRVEPVTVGGKTFQRTYVTGFATKAAAQAFCAKLSAAGHSCIVR